MPAVTRVRVVPETVHCESVDDEKETVRPEDAVAESAATLIPRVLSAREANVMVWEACVTTMVLVVVVSRKTSSASFVAVTMQLPTASPVSVVPKMVQAAEFSVKVTAPLPSPPDVVNVSVSP